MTVLFKLYPVIQWSSLSVFLNVSQTYTQTPEAKENKLNKFKINYKTYLKLLQKMCAL